jgi:hypothetical protein
VAPTFATLPPFMKRAICLMSLVSMAILAGCGSGGGSTPTQITPPTAQSPKKLSKADFIKAADGYCAELNAALGALANGTTTSDPAALAGDLNQYYGGLILHLRDLGTPDDQTGLNAFLTAGEDIATAEGKVQQAARNGDSAAVASAQNEVASAESRFASAASAYGFQQCGQGATTTSTSTSGTATAPSTAAPVTPTTTTPTPVAPAPSGGTGGATGTGTGGGTGGGSTGTGGGTGGTSGGSGGVGPG